MMKKKRNYYATIYITIVVFGIFVGTGLFYLSVTYDIPYFSSLIPRGSLSPNKIKKPTDNSYINLNLTNAYIEEKEHEDNVRISSNKKYLSFSLTFGGDTDVKIIKFKIKNVGNKRVILEKMTMNKELDPQTGITIIWPDLNNLVLAPGETSAEYSIIVSCDESGTRNANNIKAYLNYEEYLEGGK